MLNRIVALLLILSFSPLFFIFGLFIILEDGYPIIFKQKRIGVNNSYFFIYKFRTMRTTTPNVASHLLIFPEKYLLKIGTFLRKSSLDEIPNLINVFKGDMVFVGPRPALYNQVDLMELRISNGVDKLKPGITGWAQINGRDEISLEEKVKLEKDYLERRNFWFDLFIVLKTLTSVLGSKGVVH